MGTWTTKFRGPALIAGMVTLAIAVTPAFAAGKTQSKHQPSKSEHIGVTSGFLVGAAAGGPIGGAVGAVIGSVLGERNHRKAQALAAREAEARELAGEIESLNGSLVSLEGRAGEMGSTVQFRTGETLVRDADRARLAKLGALVAGLPEVRVRVTGHADSRGDEALNLSLSQERAEMVANELARAGVPKERLVIEAQGERFASNEAVADDQAFERCVEIRVESATDALASRN